MASFHINVMPSAESAITNMLLCYGALLFWIALLAILIGKREMPDAD